MKRNLFSKLSLISLVMLALLFVVPAAYAFDGREGDTIVIGSDEVVEDDLYVGAEQVVIDGTIRGDLVVGANSIIVNGTVEGDLFAAAQTVVINGVVQDSARIAGAVLQIGEGARLESDLLAAGYSLEIEPGAQIGGDLAFAGYQSMINGPVAGDAYVSGERAALYSEVGGDLNVTVAAQDEPKGYMDPTMFIPAGVSVPNVPGGLTIGDEASIGGNLTYTSPDAISVSNAQVGGAVRHVVPSYTREQRVEVTPQNLVLNWLADNFRRLIALAAVGLLLAWVAPAWIRRPASRLESQPLPSFGWGVITLVVFPFAMLLILTLVIVLALVMGALTLGNLLNAIGWLGAATILALLVTFGLILGYLTKIIVGYFIGQALLRRINPQWIEKPYLPVLVGVVILALVLAIPILGGLINLVITILGLGALFILWKDRYQAARPPAPVSEISA